MPVGNISRAILPDLGEAEYNKLNAGVSLFQCVWPGKVLFDKAIWGFYDLQTFDITTNPNAAVPQYDSRWLTGQEAQIWFHRMKGKSDVAIAWVPDDKFWHNRMLFMDSPRTYRKMISMLRGADGNDLSAAQCQFEIACLEEELKCQTPIYKIMRNGIEVDHTLDKKEAEEIKNEMKLVPRKDKATGTVIYVELRGVKYGVVEDMKIDYKSEIKQLKAIEGPKHKYGWTECDEFMKVIRPKVLKTIQERQNEVPATDATKESVMSVLATLSDEDIKALRDKLLGKEPAKAATLLTASGVEKRPAGRPKKILEPVS